MTKANGIHASVHGIHKDLHGKRVLVTAASAGIGRATALAFGANGAIVTVVSRTQERLDAVVSQLKQGYSVVGDLTDTDDCARIVEEAKAKMGGLDILVNNGAPMTDAILAEIGKVGALEKSFQLHVSATYAMIKAAESELIANKGAVVNVSSVASVAPAQSPFFLSYNIAKAAQDKMMESLALEYARYGVRINSVLPAWTRTQALDLSAQFLQIPVEAFEAKAAALHAMKRISSPEEQAAIIVFLASDAAGFVTGHKLVADGGATLMLQTQPEPDA